MLLKIEGNRAVLQTRATPKILAVVSRLEGRRSWLKNSAGLAIENTPHNISVLLEVDGVVLDTDKDPQNIAAGAQDEFDLGNPTYKPKTKPYDHQLRALKAMQGKHAFGLFMEQGTGKTKTLIDWAGDLWSQGKITGVLVVSRKGVHRQWIESEIPAHFNGEFIGVHWPVKKFPDSLLSGSELKWLAFNYDGIKTVSGAEVAEQFCAAHKGKLLIIADESQEIKTHTSGRYKAMTGLKQYSSHRALATGTPIAKDLTDEWAQMRWLDEAIVGIRYITAFRAEYCILGGFEGKVVVGHKNLAAFKQKVDPYTFRATKDEIGILPKQYNEWHFDLTRSQISLMRELKQSLEAVLATGDTMTVANAAVAINKFQQIAGGFVIDDDQIVHRLMPCEDNPRVVAAIEWLEAGEGKAVIWARYREDMKLLAEALKAKGKIFVEYHGGVNDAGRAQSIKSFMDTEGAQVFLANPQSAGTGLNLQGLCNRALYYSNSFNAIDRWQSEDRIHRIGTVGAVTYTDLIGKRSTDRRIISNLKQKKGFSDLALSDLRQMLDDLG